LPDVRRELRDRSYLFALLLAIVLLAINIALVPRFASPAAWADDLKAFAPLALLAMASTPAVLSGGGGLDISVGPLADVISIVFAVEEKYGVEIPQDAFNDTVDLGNFIDTLRGLIEKSSG